MLIVHNSFDFCLIWNSRGRRTSIYQSLWTSFNNHNGSLCLIYEVTKRFNNHNSSFYLIYEVIEKVYFLVEHSIQSHSPIVLDYLFWEQCQFRVKTTWLFTMYIDNESSILKTIVIIGLNVQRRISDLSCIVTIKYHNVPNP